MMLGSHDAGYRRTMTGQPLATDRVIRPTGRAQPRAIRARGARGEHVQEEVHGVRATVLRTTHARAMLGRVQAPNVCQGSPGSTAPVPAIPCLIPVSAIVMSFSTAATNAR